MTSVNVSSSGGHVRSSVGICQSWCENQVPVCWTKVWVLAAVQICLDRGICFDAILGCSSWCWWSVQIETNYNGPHTHFADYAKLINPHTTNATLNGQIYWGMSGLLLKHAVITVFSHSLKSGHFMCQHSRYFRCEPALKGWHEIMLQSQVEAP